MQERFRHRLQREFLEKRTSNTRYSLRAFALFLGSDHSTVSQILRAKRPVPAFRIRRWAKKLGMPAEEAAAYVAAEHLPEAAVVERQAQVRHWTAEAMAVAMDQTHWKLLRLMRRPEFRHDCRWISKELDVTVDEVNVALTRLLRLGLLRTTASGKWIETSDPTTATEREFRILALTRIREHAAQFKLPLPSTAGRGVR
jgi:transcriptional regulator with XRE-family HTH domain